MKFICIKKIFNDKAFTLMEVMIAISILSMGVLAVTNMQMTSMRISNSSNKLTTAHMITQSLVEELMSLKFTDPKLSDSTEEGIFTLYEHTSNLEGSINLKYDYDVYKGYSLGWAVDDRSDGTKTINVITTWQGIREEKVLVFPLRRSVQQSLE